MFVLRAVGFTLFIILFSPLLRDIYARAFELSSEIKQFAWFYKPPQNGNLKALATRFHFFIFTRGDETTRNRLRSLGVKAPILLYVLFDKIQDPGSCSAEPLNNQVAWNKGDFCDISKNHPDWFLLDQQGQRIRHEFRKRTLYVMDPGSPGWQQYWCERVDRIKRQGWDGIFLDVVDSSLLDLFQRGQLPLKYKDNESYQIVIDNFLTRIHDFLRPNGLLVANVSYVLSGSAWQRYLRHLDGVMIEAFATGWDENHLSPGRWEEQLKRVQETQKADKRLLLVSQGKQDEKERQQFAYASFLLVASGKAAFRYASEGQYDHLWLFPNYDYSLGDPIGERYKKSDGTWMREFKHGTVYVNPFTFRSGIHIKDQN